MSHHHHHNDSQISGIRLLITLILNLIITAAEVIGGLISGSLSLISDALHNFSDGVAIVISYIAIRLNRRPKSTHYTFGLRRAEIIAAIINSSVLVMISIYLFYKAYLRFLSPQSIEGELMIITAMIGLLANTIGTLLLRVGAKDNMNIRSAYLHLLSDAISSMGVIIGGIAIYLWNIYWIDPILTIAISIYILKESFHILKEALDIVLMASPEDISITDINNQLTALEGIKNIHHVHLWQMDEKNIHFEAHADIDDCPVSKTQELLKTIEMLLHRDYDINHVTIQFECDACEVKELLNV
jgi:cobalt-zinc-cadmium efflux system protein